MLDEKEPLLRVKDLSISFPAEKGLLTVTHAVSFDLYPGEILGIVGESGSGKSVTALAVMGLLGNGSIEKGSSICFNGSELTKLSDRDYSALRGAELAMIFQEPMTSLNPVYTAGKQVQEVLRLHNKELSKTAQKEKVLELFELTGLRNAKAVYDSYPHQLSGGMRQRVMIAMAMLCRPKLIIADEPTTALDVTVQAKILGLLKTINKEYGTSILFISHDLSVIRAVCKRSVIMHEGMCVEQGITEELFKNPENDYTKQLLKASYGVDYRRKEERNSEAKIKAAAVSKDVLLSVKELDVYYQQKTSRKNEKISVVKQASFELFRGECLGIVGESGSGKSSIAKAIAGLNSNCSGEIKFHFARDLSRPQMVFQDPYSSLNPSKTIGWLLQEPLKLLKYNSLNMENWPVSASRSSRKKLFQDQASRMLERVGLPKNFVQRYPAMLSGGQRQRAALALSLMAGPELIILDEPVSALDVTVQEQILELLAKLRKQFGFSYLFISHDLNVVRRFCDRIFVMYRGELIEHGTADELFQHPIHEYTKSLLESILLPNVVI